MNITNSVKFMYLTPRMIDTISVREAAQERHETDSGAKMSIILRAGAWWVETPDGRAAGPYHTMRDAEEFMDWTDNQAPRPPAGA